MIKKSKGRQKRRRKKMDKCLLLLGSKVVEKQEDGAYYLALKTLAFGNTYHTGT